MAAHTTAELADRYAKAADGLTIPALVHRNATEFAGQPALTTLGADDTLTWGELRDRVAAISRGLAALGLRPGDRMLIMMASRPEHWLVDLAAAHLGAVPSTVYATHEGSGASEIQIRDRFRAYDSAEAGATDYLSLLQRRYPDALQAAERGDPVGFVQALKAHGYFSGDEASYAKSVAGLAQRALAAGFDEIGAGETGAISSPNAVASAFSLDRGDSGADLSAPATSVDAHGNMVIPPGAYAHSFADEIGRVELLISALRIGQLGDKAG